jgi:Fic family protein
MYIHQLQNWPDFNWRHEALLHRLGTVRHLQGKLLGKMSSLGFRLRQEATLETLTQDVLKTTEIEGEFLNPEQVRSSIARRLGLNISGSAPSDRDVEGIVEMMLDATRNCEQPLSAERMFNWHASLFPTGRSGMYRIVTGAWRTDATGPIQVVSGEMGRETVHFQAPDARTVHGEMAVFMRWFNQKTDLDPVLKAAVAHLWFITIHPFEDGNGRVARAITDLQLSRADDSIQRFYSMSAQIRIERNRYYTILEQTQKGNLDITDWLIWFLDCLSKSIDASDQMLTVVLKKARFWEKHQAVTLNERQRQMLNKLLDGFEGKLNTSKWAKITKCSPDTALRDIQDLVDKQILHKAEAGGRSTSYNLS